MREWLEKIDSIKDLNELEDLRVKITGKKGILTAEFSKMKSLNDDERKELAKTLNEFKIEFNTKLEERKATLDELKSKEILQKDRVDFSLYHSVDERGAFHPVLDTLDRITEYFVGMNFSIATGPVVEDDFHNFEALNLPKHHPARDMQDTFYFKDFSLLRTHTSPVQIREMLKSKPPIRMISPGSVFRRDFDLTHTPMFHQVEGLVVEEEGKVSFANLKYILEDFLTHMFGDVKVRFRPSFFPFTEPSAEVDISCIFCSGKGCRVCSHTGWLEVLGCGLVDNNVFKSVGYSNVSGYAFGLGVERFAMLIHKISDLRSLFEGDLRLLEQFK